MYSKSVYCIYGRGGDFTQKKDGNEDMRLCDSHNESWLLVKCCSERPEALFLLGDGLSDFVNQELDAYSACAARQLRLFFAEETETVTVGEKKLLSPTVIIRGKAGLLNLSLLAAERCRHRLYGIPPRAGRRRKTACFISAPARCRRAVCVWR